MAFHRAALGRPSRELLRRTLGCFALDNMAPGIAVDLGCGSGAETLEMLRRGWEVHAVDVEDSGLVMLRDSVPPEFQNKLHTYARKFEDFEFPSCDLVWAGYSFPFCSAADWPVLWTRLLAALRPGGRIAGDIFGEHHAFASESDVLVFVEQDVRHLLSSLVIEAFDVENGYRPSGSELMRWHAFGIAARKP